MFSAVHVIGTGRAGGAIRAGWRSAGCAVTDGREPDPGAELVLLACRTRSIAEVAAGVDGRAVDRARQRRDAPGGARSARAALQRPSAPDADPRARRRAARRRVGRRQRRDRRTPWRAPAGWPRRSACALRGRRCGPRALPRRRRSSAATSSSRSIASRRALLAEVGAPPEAIVPLMTPHDRERLRPDRADRPRRLGDRRGAPRRARASAHPDLVPLYRALAEATRE